MIKLVTCAQMKKLDEHTIKDMGMPSLVLMERAALAVCQELEREPERLKKVLVACGSGNNGGDGFAIARILRMHGFDSQILCVGNPEHLTKEAALQKKIADNYHVPMVNNPAYGEYTTIVDAIFGIGLSREITGRIKEIIEGINASPAFRAAVDIPSGVCGDTGRVLGTAVRADLTVTFAYGKPGQFLNPGARFCGQVLVKDIGIYAQEEPDLQIFQDPALKLFPRRTFWGNKGTFGKGLIVAGSKGMCGAAYLSARGFLAMGAGMVKIQTVEENRTVLQCLFPEAMVSTEDTLREWQENLDWCDLLVIGPGMGTGEESRRRAEFFLRESHKAGTPVVLDADGLNLLGKNPDWYEWLKGRCVITPHVGEMARLVKKEISEVSADLIGTAQRFAAQKQVVCVLKDARTVTAYPDGRTYLNISGSSGMATAGCGDVLTGFLGGLLCVGRDGDHPALVPLGVYLHGRAGEEAEKRMGKAGMKAGDLIDALARVLNGE